MSSGTGDLFGFLLLVAIAYWAAVAWQDREYVTVHRAWCIANAGGGMLKADECWTRKDTSWQPYTVKYRISFAEQRVFRVGVLLERYDACTVANNDNWSCKTDGGNFSFGAIDGNFSSTEEYSRSLGYLEYLQLSYF